MPPSNIYMNWCDVSEERNSWAASGKASVLLEEG